MKNIQDIHAQTTYKIQKILNKAKTKNINLNKIIYDFKVEFKNNQKVVTFFIISLEKKTKNKNHKMIYDFEFKNHEISYYLLFSEYLFKIYCLIIQKIKLTLLGNFVGSYQHYEHYLAP